MALRKKKLGERIGAGLVQMKGSEDTPQVFSVVSDNILSYDYHYDDVYQQLGRFMCFSEYDENGKLVKKAACCKMYKKRQDRVLVPVIHYEGGKKNYRKLADGKVKYLSITSYKYNQLCKELDDAGVDFADCDVDILLKCEDEKRGKISFEVLSSDGALWKEDEDMQKLVKDAMSTYEEDIMASLPVEYSPEEFARLIAEAEEEGQAPDGVETPNKSSKSDIPKKKKTKEKVEKDLDDDLDDEDEEEIPKKKKKSVKEQIEEEDFDNDDLEDEEDEDEVEEDEEEEEYEPPKKKKKRPEPEDDEDEDEDDDLEDDD